MKKEKQKERTDSANRRSVLKMKNYQARKFFLKNENYCDLRLPAYFRFDELLDEIASATEGKSILDFCHEKRMVKKFDDINHVLFNNKDGKYAWRPMSLIHPFIYVLLVNAITEEEAWNHICKVFKKHGKHPTIQCHSLPVEKISKKKKDKAKKDRAEQILYWWEEIEQKSIELSLTYQYLAKTDITNCYSSIYTHSIAWALHGKERAKANRMCYGMIGNLIDLHLQSMNFGQTNGIPQGSVLMDFIAEMVLGYADDMLAKSLREELPSLDKNDYCILRYRDDYRIFSQTQQVGEDIVKCLSTNLMKLGLKLSPEKTEFTNKLINKAQKPEKRYWITQRRYDKAMQKHLIIIHELADKHPNSGGLIRALDEFYARIPARYNRKDVPVLIAIVTDIAYHNPRTYHCCCAIISRLLKFTSNNEKRIIVNKICKKFQNLPNTEHLEIWLQRISIKSDRSLSYEAKLCKAVSEENNVRIWNSKWIKGKIKKKIDAFNPVNQKILDELSDVIFRDEYSEFSDHY